MRKSILGQSGLREFIVNFRTLLCRFFPAEFADWKTFQKHFMDQLIFHHIMRAKSIARKLSNSNNNIDNNDDNEKNEKTRLLNSFLKSRRGKQFSNGVEVEVDI